MKRVLAGLVGLIAFAVSTGAPVSATPEEPGAEHRLVTRGEMGVRVPPPGMTVTLELFMPEGNHRTLSVEHRRDGTVHTAYSGDKASSDPNDQTKEGSTTGSILAPCSDSAFTYHPIQRVAGNMSWFFNDDVMPSPTPTQLKSSFISASANLSNADNDCGMFDYNTSPSVTDVTDTAFRSNFYIAANGSHDCGSADVYSVFEFGQLKDALASMCAWTYSNGTLYAADIRFNKLSNWFTSATSPCSNDSLTGTKYWDFEGIATHEIGHVLGLNHTVPDNSTDAEKTLHSKQTMSGVANFAEARCNTGYRTLGRGDALGLEYLY